MLHSLTSDLAHALDAAAFAEDRLGFRPDPWQRRVLRSQSQQILLNCCRQSGKSTTTAVLSLHTALYTPGALILLISPTQRQSKELFAKVVLFLRSLEPAETLEEDNRLSCTLANGARIVSLPGDEKTIRGYSGPALIVEDEASRVLDTTHVAARPMLAVSGGRLVLMSTPSGRRGHFFEAWHGPVSEGWEKIELTAAQCPRISAEFLGQEERVLGPIMYQQEYFCAFLDDAMSAFQQDLIAAALTDDFLPFLEMEAA